MCGLVCLLPLPSRRCFSSPIARDDMQTPPRPGGLLLEALPLPPTPDSAPRRASLLAQELEEIAPALTKRMREGTPPEVCVLAAIRQAALVRAPVTQVNDFTVVSLSASGRTKTVVFSPPVEHSFATLDLSSRWTSSITATLAQVTLRDVGFTLDDLAAPRKRPPRFSPTAPF